MQNVSIQVEDLPKIIPEAQCLERRESHRATGQYFALLGSNGAGKTTLVKILTTLLKQDGGTAIVNGFDVASKPDNVRHHSV